MDTIYTIGHSTHPAEYFVEMLRAHGIDCVVDVRSTPASKYNPQYNQRPLSAYLQQHAVRYLHLPAEFGARHTDPEVQDETGRVDFDKVRRSEAFREGVRRLETGLERGFRIALMCSEAEPLDCHRFGMISVHLARMGYAVQHILKDKSLMTNEELENRMLEKYQKKLPKPSLFEPDVSEKQQLEAAYQLLNRDIGWTAKALPTETEEG
ncbi:MAG: DUF488 family protein [Saprospiraceae bacterium]